MAKNKIKKPEPIPPFEVTVEDASMYLGASNLCLNRFSAYDLDAESAHVRNEQGYTVPLSGEGCRIALRHALAQCETDEHAEAIEVEAKHFAKDLKKAFRDKKAADYYRKEYGFILVKMERVDRIKAGLLWQVYTETHPDHVLCEGTKGACKAWIHANGYNTGYKVGSIRLGQLIAEN